jgi:hypothetical protein
VINPGGHLERRVSSLAIAMRLGVREHFKLGRRIWGATRYIDRVIEDERHRRVGVECKWQQSQGSAEEKVLATIADLATWPIRGIIVLDGQGFSEAMVLHVLGTGKAVLFEDLETWLRLFFEMPIDTQMEMPT